MRVLGKALEVLQHIEKLHYMFRACASLAGNSWRYMGIEMKPNSENGQHGVEILRCSAYMRENKQKSNPIPLNWLLNQEVPLTDDFTILHRILQRKGWYNLYITQTIWVAPLIMWSNFRCWWLEGDHRENTIWNTCFWQGIRRTIVPWILPHHYCPTQPIYLVYIMYLGTYQGLPTIPHQYC